MLTDAPIVGQDYYSTAASCDHVKSMHVFVFEWLAVLR
jgi:hypothetical protein